MELHFKTREDAIAYAETQGTTLYDLIQMRYNLNSVYVHDHISCIIFPFHSPSQRSHSQFCQGYRLIIILNLLTKLDFPNTY